jgi:hypothetical protein
MSSALGRIEGAPSDAFSEGGVRRPQRAVRQPFRG